MAAWRLVLHKRFLAGVPFNVRHLIAVADIQLFLSRVMEVPFQQHSMP